MKAANGVWSADLHVHTPASSCYSDKNTKPEDIVTAAVAAGLDAIAITDHNSGARINDIKETAAKYGLTVFPGVELSTNMGHILGIFDTDTPVATVEGMLEYLGVSAEGRGEGAYIIGKDIEQILEAVEEAGGISVAAHIDRWPSGLIHTNLPKKQKLNLLRNNRLTAAEITIAGNRESWMCGQMPGFPVKPRCIQCSDAHSPDEIGRRRIQVHGGSIRLTGLRQLLNDGLTGISFE